jgi:hypothetical protein
MRAAEEAMEKMVADKEATNKRTANETAVKGATVGADADSSALLSGKDQEGGDSKWLHPPAKQPYRRLCWRVDLLDVELACLACLHQLDGVLEGCRPVKSVLKGFTDQHAGGYMIHTLTSMDLLTVRSPPPD